MLAFQSPGDEGTALRGGPGLLRVRCDGSGSAKWGQSLGDVLVAALVGPGCRRLVLLRVHDRRVSAPTEELLDDVVAPVMTRSWMAAAMRATSGAAASRAIGNEKRPARSSERRTINRAGARNASKKALHGPWKPDCYPPARIPAAASRPAMTVAAVPAPSMAGCDLAQGLRPVIANMRWGIESGSENPPASRGAS